MGTPYLRSTNKYGIRVRFIESFRNRAGSSMFRRQRKTRRAGTTPRPSESRHTARRWLGPNLYMFVKWQEPIKRWQHTSSIEPGEQTPRIRSLDLSWCLVVTDWVRASYSFRIYTELVASANQRCWAFLLIEDSSDCSEAETDPLGYSAPSPIPSRNLAV